MNQMNELVTSVSKLVRDARSSYHLTLGQLIEKLKKLDPDTFVTVDGIDSEIINPHSYRGYYEDLALETEDGGTTTVKSLLKILEMSLNTTFQGYKGGDYKMSADTPLWLSPYGSASNVAIMDLLKETSGRSVALQTKKIE